jgi:hypothetical protein
MLTSLPLPMTGGIVKSLSHAVTAVTKQEPAG